MFNVYMMASFTTMGTIAVYPSCLRSTLLSGILLLPKASAHFKWYIFHLPNLILVPSPTFASNSQWLPHNPSTACHCYPLSLPS